VIPDTLRLDAESAVFFVASQAVNSFSTSDSLLSMLSTSDGVAIVCVTVSTNCGGGGAGGGGFGGGGGYGECGGDEGGGEAMFPMAQAVNCWTAPYRLFIVALPAASATGQLDW